MCLPARQTLPFLNTGEMAASVQSLGTVSVSKVHVTRAVVAGESV